MLGGAGWREVDLVEVGDTSKHRTGHGVSEKVDVAGIEARNRDLVAWERRANDLARGRYGSAERIVNLFGPVAEIAVQVGGGGHSIQSIGRRVLDVTLIRDKKERAVMNDRATQGCAKHILTQRRYAGAEKIPGIEGIVAQELPARAVKRVGARFCDYIDHAARYEPEFCLVVVGLHLELLNRVDDGRNGVDAGVRRGVEHTVEQEHIATIALPIESGIGDDAHGIAGETAATVLRNIGR